MYKMFSIILTYQFGLQSDIIFLKKEKEELDKVEKVILFKVSNAE